MYFALGFLVAGLFTLMFLPAFWRRAMRLSMRRLQMLAPMSMEEVVAERDLLRAEFAVRQRQLEQEMETVRVSKTTDLAEIGRYAARTADLEERLKKAETANRDTELQWREAQKVAVERTDLLRSTEMALHEMTERAERGVERLRLHESDKEEFARRTEAHQSHVGAHEAKIGALHTQNGDLRRDLEKLHADLAAASQEAARLPGLESEAAKLAADLESSHDENRSLTSALDEVRAKLAQALAHHKDEVEHLENALRLARGEARDHADRLETTRADNAMLQGAVDALRKEHTNQRHTHSTQGLPAKAAAGADGEKLSERDVLALRQALVEIGDRMVEIGAAPPSRDTAPSQRAL